MPIRRRSQNRQCFTPNRRYAQPYRPASAMVPEPAPMAAPPRRTPYDPDTFYECDGGMIPLKRNAPQHVPESQAAASPQSSQSLPKDQASGDTSHFPWLYSPVHRLYMNQP